MSERTKPLAYAMKLLGARDKSEAQLRAALERKGYLADEIDATVAQLKRLKYLDDRRVAESKARTELAGRQSRSAVARRVASLGIEESLAEAAVGEVAAELGQHDEASARALIAKRALVGEKGARFLAARGFDEALIRRLLALPED